MADQPDSSRHVAVSLLVLGLAASWNAGTIASAATAVGTDLDISLAAVGALGGTLFFAGLVIAKLGAARLAVRVGATGTVRIACVACLVGNVLAAAGADPARLGGGRLLAGIGLGLTLVVGPVLARQYGGGKLIGLFGASVTLAVAGAIAAGTLAREAGLDWQADFFLAAALAALALALTPRHSDVEIPAGSVLATFERSIRSAAFWRLELLFTTALGIPYILGIWLVPFLTTTSGLTAAAAGVLGFTLYGLNAALRRAGGRWDAEGRSLTLLGGIAPLVAAGGLVIVAISDSTAISIVGIVLAGGGFAVPYAAMYDEAVRLFPGARIAAVGVLTVGGNALPMAVAPLIGKAIEEGNGELALVALALVPLLAGLLNLRPPVPAS